MINLWTLELFDLSVTRCQKPNNCTQTPELSYFRANYRTFKSRLWCTQNWVCFTAHITLSQRSQYIHGFTELTAMGPDYRPVFMTELDVVTWWNVSRVTETILHLQQNHLRNFFGTFVSNKFSQVSVKILLKIMGELMLWDESFTSEIQVITNYQHHLNVCWHWLHLQIYKVEKMPLGNKYLKPQKL